MAASTRPSEGQQRTVTLPKASRASAKVSTGWAHDGPVPAAPPPLHLPGRALSLGGASSIVVKCQRPGRGPEEHDLTCGKTAPAWKRGPTWSPFGVVTKDVAWGHRELSRCVCTCEQVPEREAEHTAPYGWPGRGARSRSHWGFLGSNHLEEIRVLRVPGCCPPAWRPPGGLPVQAQLLQVTRRGSCCLGQRS